ncbi:expressed unknown protein [Seminavis robusta]|uniref:Uncharacterized protein n=1 Tax=Seminavis robusta TaxID=568900 RepID=A0A9N8HY10_9STRA|nr:expressed unknown protein [Seminavis robusta]|eukprot:Sro2654_g333810.1 n/a (245) ;mRNA; r:4892-5626
MHYLGMNSPISVTDNAGPQQGVSQHCLLIRNAAYFNREGATRLVTGDLDGAFAPLFAALETLALAGGLLPSQGILSAYFARTFPFEQAPKRPSPKNTRPSRDEGSYFVYGNPFVFQPIDVDTPEYATNCTAVCLFNLALAYHKRGQLADSQSLFRARTLYAMSLQLVDSMSCQAACANLKVAGTNNKAHVHFEVSDVGDAKNTLRDLLIILGTKGHPPPFAEDEIEKFYMNILHLNGSTLAAAA